jgi:DNA-binding transcriptional MerR regulator
LTSSAYETTGLIGPIARDESTEHRRYRTEDLDVLHAPACIRAVGVGTEDMRTYHKPFYQFVGGCRAVDAALTEPETRPAEAGG